MIQLDYIIFFRWVESAITQQPSISRPVSYLRFRKSLMSIMVITGTMAGACLGSWALLKASKRCPLDLDLGEICLDEKKRPSFI